MLTIYINTQSALLMFCTQCYDKMEADCLTELLVWSFIQTALAVSLSALIRRGGHYLDISHLRASCQPRPSLHMEGVTSTEGEHISRCALR